MAKRKSNPRLMLRLVGLTVIIGALAMGVGLPALLMSQEGTRISDPDALRRIIFMILGGGLGAGAVLILISFFVKGRDG
ncbi:hypothetical protein [Parasulfitobacter algicola]|uniref:Uncharacterized protein n=1 Tax=Parasulfitobacter algicola TaxID=2614809 RepID=A0ABX2IKT1_9RHOB|nr:hypothetical protein [Sulfitobacter algicola]NSX53474.1 hypothetical protein [Sulfitobacter algicola]